MKNYREMYEPILIGLLAFVGLAAVGGGIGLMVANGSGLPADTLSYSLFDSFVVPGLLLAIVVGGSQLVAAYLLLANRRHGLATSLLAGFILLAWIYGELYVTHAHSWLQTLMFAIGIIEVGFVALMHGSATSTLKSSRKSLHSH